jgi:hypothetical protein
VNARTGDASTDITTREQLFTWLPAPEDPLSRYWSRHSNSGDGKERRPDAYNFLTANLHRKYGANWYAPWKSTSLKRMKSWGFNTLGNWSDDRLYRNGKVPYTGSVYTWGNHAKVRKGGQYPGEIHDPFDPTFAVSVAACIKPVVVKCLHDPWCLGYFVDNELYWTAGSPEEGRYLLALGVLAAKDDQPAKAAFLSQLRSKYHDIAALNSAWRTSFKDWSDLAGPYIPKETSKPIKADLAAFTTTFARKYFTVVRDELKRQDPDHLYLGCRFSSYTREQTLACAEVADVVSYNPYRELLPSGHGFSSEFDKPCLVGEFHFGSLDRGMFQPGLIGAPNQTARGGMYQDYVNSVLDNPKFVGCHWFQCYDEPLTARSGDYENFNIGFLTVGDSTYPEMVKAAREVNGQAYARRYYGKK